MTEPKLSECCGAAVVYRNYGDMPVEQEIICISCRNACTIASQTYSLNCENCGDVFRSVDAFPKPQLCQKCLEQVAKKQGMRELARIYQEENPSSYEKYKVWWVAKLKKLGL